MHKRILAIGVVLVCALASAGPASATRRLVVHPRSGVPLPFFVTSNHYWLYAGPMRTRRRVIGNDDYIRLVAEPVGNIVPVGPDFGFEW